ncbi:MarR family transcriptional regulator [Frankia sp. CNm7]|uniref:MarR family transcriptional regulator n=2 Tax=Frankia nepalensis TaxID=1836974 RepID=A0A937RDZ0_9ACTN|nr:MarR family transcriptional regulator [Frankia nepalensis]MBL7514803.1 MarR family transcriptional regulator [Frankia nepalensis]MBL7517801.1 MarR family transcriptional regulator [Frankia nepalensis]MBL7628492.1 MarR family transcriptional regulator [Frankia nepalensis]
MRATKEDDAGPGAVAERVDARGMRAWRGLLRAHAQVTRVLEAELEEAHKLPLASYDVLVQLAEAPNGALRMSELADAVLLSRSGLTRLVDRLVREGLVERQSCPSDLRGTLAVLTPAGLARLRAASGTHLRGVARHVLSRYSPTELELLGDLLGRLATPAEATGACGQEDRAIGGGPAA